MFILNRTVLTPEKPSQISKRKNSRGDCKVSSGRLDAVNGWRRTGISVNRSTSPRGRIESSLAQLMDERSKRSMTYSQAKIQSHHLPTTNTKHLHHPRNSGKRNEQASHSFGRKKGVSRLILKFSMWLWWGTVCNRTSDPMRSVGGFSSPFLRRNSHGREPVAV